MTGFFIPELDPLGASAEDVYTGICQAAHAETGHPPQELRIHKLSYRQHGVDREAEVGRPDPMSGHTVLAILDLGRRRPYLIHCGRPGGLAEQVIVDKPVYAATEFTAGSPLGD